MTISIPISSTRRETPLPQGTPQARSFIERDYGAYVSDSYRATRELTLNFGVRYENFRPLYEANGTQVAPTVRLERLLRDSQLSSRQGVPQNAMPNAILSWDLNGPANGKPTWWKPSNLNFAPRVGLAYGPQDRGGFIGKIVREIWRHFAPAPAWSMTASAAIWLRNTINTARSAWRRQRTSRTPTASAPVRASTAPRRCFRSNPLQPFPYTPPPIAAIVGDFLGISPDLKPPYSYVLNASFEREIPGGLTFEIGYTGRLSHRLLLQGDVYTPLEYSRIRNRESHGSKTTRRFDRSSMRD